MNNVIIIIRIFTYIFTTKGEYIYDRFKGEEHRKCGVPLSFHFKSREAAGGQGFCPTGCPALPLGAAKRIPETKGKEGKLTLKKRQGNGRLPCPE